MLLSYFTDEGKNEAPTYLAGTPQDCLMLKSNIAVPREQGEGHTVLSSVVILGHRSLQAWWGTEGYGSKGPRPCIPSLCSLFY